MGEDVGSVFKILIFDVLCVQWVRNNKVKALSLIFLLVSPEATVGITEKKRQ